VRERERERERLRVDQGERVSMKTGRGVRHGCCLSQILFNSCSNYLTKEALEDFGDFKIGGQVIHTVKYADNLCYWQEEMVLQGIIDRLIN
jgi:hypothetical protein